MGSIDPTTRLGTPGVPTTVWTANDVGLKFRHVCRECNNGWMSALEAAFKAILIRFGSGESHTVTPSQRLAITRWLLTKAVVIDAMSGSDRRFFAASDGAMLKAGAITGWTAAWAALCERGANNLTAQHCEPQMSFGARRSPLRAFAFTITIETMLFQSLTMRVPDRVNDIAIGQRSAAEEHMVSLWPLGVAARWPSPEFFAKEELPRLATRHEGVHVLPVR